MELIEYGACQFVHLFRAVRPQGAAYIPEIALKIVNRYQFAKPPSLDDLTKDTVKFQMGRFNDVQISEFGVYGDGIIVNGRCPTETLAAFWDDFWAFAQEDLQSKPILKERNETHFETNIVIQSDADLAAFLMPGAQELISKAVQADTGVTFQSSGIVMDCDATVLKMRRKPYRFIIERRIGFKYEENIFLCIAPLQTKNFMELLSVLEREALRAPKK